MGNSDQIAVKKFNIFEKQSTIYSTIALVNAYKGNEAFCSFNFGLAHNVITQNNMGQVAQIHQFPNYGREYKHLLKWKEAKQALNYGHGINPETQSLHIHLYYIGRVFSCLVNAMTTLQDVS